MPGPINKDQLDEAYRARELRGLAFDWVPVGIVVTEARVIREVNRRFCAVFGYQRDELLDQLFVFLYPSDEEFLNVLHRGDKRSLGEGNLYWDERVMRRKDGEHVLIRRVRGQTFIA